MLLDDPLIFPVGPLDNPFDDLVALSLLALDRLVVDDVVELHIVFPHDLQLSMDEVRLHVGGAIGLGKTQGRVEKRVGCEGKGQVAACRLLSWQGAQGRGRLTEF